MASEARVASDLIVDMPHERHQVKAVWVFAGLYFMASYALAVHWYSQGLFAPWDFFFDADAGMNLKAFSTGGGRYAVTHPLLELIKLPVLASGFVLSKVTPMTLPQASFGVALAVTPLASSLTLVLLFQTLVRLGIAATAASLVTVFFGFWNSNIVFAVIPETYALSCLLITTLFFVLASRWPPQQHAIALFLLGVAIAGVTLTNIIVFGLVVWAFRGGPRSGWPVVFSEGGRAAAIVALVLTTYYAMITLFKREAGSEGSAEWVQHFLVLDGPQNAANVVNLVCQFITMIFAVAPTQQIYGLSFTRDLSLASAAVLLCAVGVVSLIVWSRRLPRPEGWAWVERAALMLIAYNFALHAVFGREMFLYTQHWVLPTLLLLVPALAQLPKVTIAAALTAAAINLSFVASIGPEDVTPSQPTVGGVRSIQSSVEQQQQ